MVISINMAVGHFIIEVSLNHHWIQDTDEYSHLHTVYPKKYAHGFCFAVLCCGYTLTDFPISIRLTSLALWQSNDCPSASKATPMNMDKYFMWIHYERLHNHNKAKHNETVCIFLGIYCKTMRCNFPPVLYLQRRLSMGEQLHPTENRAMQLSTRALTVNYVKGVHRKRGKFI